MTILVFSDSHSSLGFMRRCMEFVRPDGVIHLGDYFDDGEGIRETVTGTAARRISRRFSSIGSSGWIST